MKMIVGALVATLLSSTAANAAVLNFAIGGSDPFSFQIDQMPKILVSNDILFKIENIKTNDGFTGSAKFYTNAYFGGLIVDVGPNTRFDALGPQLFTGPTNAPTFLTGTFLTNHGTVTISAVPESATWGMMLVGFGMMGGALRYRRRTTNVAFS